MASPNLKAALATALIGNKERDVVSAGFRTALDLTSGGSEVVTSDLKEAGIFGPDARRLLAAAAAATKGSTFVTPPRAAREPASLQSSESPVIPLTFKMMLCVGDGKEEVEAASYDPEYDALSVTSSSGAVIWSSLQDGAIKIAACSIEGLDMKGVGVGLKSEVEDIKTRLLMSAFDVFNAVWGPVDSKRKSIIPGEVTKGCSPGRTEPMVGFVCAYRLLTLAGADANLAKTFGGKELGGFSSNKAPRGESKGTPLTKFLPMRSAMGTQLKSVLMRHNDGKSTRIAADEIAIKDAVWDKIRVAPVDPDDTTLVALKAMSKGAFDLDANKVIKNWWSQGGGKGDDSASVIKKNFKQAVDDRLAGRPAASELHQLGGGGDLTL